MGAFIFRADAALELRRRKEDAARRARATAEASLVDAEQRVADARATLDRTLAEAAAVQDPSQRLWYRNWMTRQHQEIARRRAVASERRAALEGASMAERLARRDVRALERLRTRVQAAWALAERRQEQKELDWLGCVQHALASADRDDNDERTES